MAKNEKDIKEEVIEMDGLEIDDEVKAKKVKKLANPEITEDDDYVELTVEDRIVNIEKRTNTIFVLVLITIVAILLNTIVMVNRTTVNKTVTEEETNQSSNSGYDTSKFDEITGDEIEKLSKDNTIVVLIARQTCSYCSLYAPIITEAQEQYGFTTKYIDLTKMIDMSSSSLVVTDEDSYEGLFNVGADKKCVSTAVDQSGNEIPCSDFIEKEFGATPLTLIIRDNKLVYAIAGYVDATTLSSALEASGFSA